ncbi:MAG: phage holin family protein [Candidatus Promineofilum sp.]|nr:phage holin family protein [Promineifilum sp.]
MHIIRSLLRIAIRFVVIWAVSATSLVATAWLLPGIRILPVAQWSPWQVALAAAFILGLINLLIRPLILLLAMPLGFIVLFVVGFFVNAITLRLTALLFFDGLVVDGWVSAFIGGLLLASIISLVSAILGIEDAGSFYEGVIERRLSAQRVVSPDNATTGLVMLEIDGLSYHHIRRALAEGYMPNVKALVERRGYALSRVDCGLPSQTSACQSGILFGDNFDIPAFRWYDKAQGKHYVSGSDAAEINARFANGRGLLRGGASVNNMVNGDADVSLLTAADLRGGTSEQKRARAHDVYLLLLNPNFFMRVVGLFLGETLLELWQYARDVIAGTRPRLNRLHNFYPLVRSTTTVFMREVSGFLTLMQIMRGEPAIYTTWPGYDEVAHHSGPWSKHAFGTLRGFDRLIGSVKEIIDTKAPRPYELILLSDHGQSFGATFLMRYGYTLEEYIRHQMPAGTVVMQSAGGDDGSQVVASTVAELENIRQHNVGGRVGQATVKQLQKAAEKSMANGPADPALEAAGPVDVTFCGSGNLAQVYFHALPQRATLDELNAAFPGMVDAVIAHEGVGLVVALTDGRRPVALGRHGAHDLHTGEVTGDDPLAPYGDVALRAWQTRRVADFPSAGDLIIISTVYPDGTVAALEELIGSHGGMGGEQTDAFILHPADMEVPPTRNSVDMFALLDARRDRPPPKETRLPAPSRDEWALGNLMAGLREAREWVGLALSALLLDRSALRAIATTGAMTGPAVLLSLVGVLAGTLMEDGPALPAGLLSRFLSRYGLWLVAVLTLHATAHILRGRGSPTQTFRVMGFAQTADLFLLLGLIPAMRPMVTAVVAVYSLFLAWLAVTEAHRFRGWRTLALPVLYFSVVMVGGFLLTNMSDGLVMAFETLMKQIESLP